MRAARSTTNTLDPVLLLHYDSGPRQQKRLAPPVLCSREQLLVGLGLSDATSSLRDLPLRQLLPIVLLVSVSGCAPKTRPSYPTAKAAAEAAFRCLEKADAECLVAFSWEPEGAKTGLTADVIRQVVKKVGPEFSKMKRDGEMQFEGGSGVSFGTQTYINSAEAKVYLNVFVVKSPSGYRLNSMSWLMSDVMNAPEIRQDENYLVGSLRGLKKNRNWYASVSWRGVMASSENVEFKTWDELEARCEASIQKQKAKKTGKG